MEAKRRFGDVDYAHASYIPIVPVLSAAFGRLKCVCTIACAARSVPKSAGLSAPSAFWLAGLNFKNAGFFGSTLPALMKLSKASLSGMISDALMVSGPHRKTTAAASAGSGALARATKARMIADLERN